MTVRCTGVAASWCPRHGTCTCGPRIHDNGQESTEERSLTDPTCPLHAPSSTHGDDAR